MRVSFCKKYLSAQEIINSEKIYNHGLSWKIEDGVEFLSGKRLWGINKLMRTKFKRVTSGKSYTYKALPEIGLNELTLKSVVKGKTKRGQDKMTITFTKSPIESWFRNGKESYLPITCIHTLSDKDGEDFDNLWFRPITFSKISENQLKTLKCGDKYKCVVLHKEDPWIENGKPMKYKQGGKIGQDIVQLKPEIIKIYNINTPDSKIPINYLRLYKAYRK